MAGIDGVNSVKFGQLSGIQTQQGQDNKIGTINMKGFDRAPEKMQAALNFITDLAQQGNGVYTPATKGFLGMGAQEAMVTLNF